VTPTAIKGVDRIRASSQQNFWVLAKHGDAHNGSYTAITVLRQAVAKLGRQTSHKLVDE